ncbi:hypothetical protein [Phocaeicola barnesiae]|uniref:hypothetical protein n=1 Tax=Phocaeicola barnesiae TaxID=376804 RepID=UPI00266EABD4|nr:hypothetical protein [Phocaeicola barnesiae]
MSDTVLSVLIPVLASALTGAATWLATRRQKRNDFIASLQHSIDSLAASYDESIKELCEVKATNLDLTLKIKQLVHENQLLRDEVNRLNSRIGAMRLSES